MEWIIGVIIGLLAGGAGGWFVQEFRAKSRLASQSVAHQTAIAALQAERDQAAADAQASHLQEVASLNTQISVLNDRMEQAATASELLESAKIQFSEAAKLTATEALRNNNQQFLDLAKENFGNTLKTAQRELDQRHQQFQELVKPLSENYGKLNPQIESLISQVQAANAETGKLASALTDNRRVGSWGEVQLRRVVELAGMTGYCDFEEQATAAGSQDRPDLIVRLPERRAVVIDAKASTAAYMEAQQAGDDAAVRAAWDKHAAALKRQVDDLSRKSYGQKVDGALDFVVMFVPGEQFLSAALDSDRDLVAYAMQRKVVIVTPASLIAMLWAVANGWQEFRLAEDARKIKETGEEMHRRMLIFIKHYQDVGRDLNRAVGAFNRSVSSFDGRVAPQGRRFAELVTGADDKFPAPEEIEQSLRISRYAGPPALSDDDGRERVAA